MPTALYSSAPKDNYETLSQIGLVHKVCDSNFDIIYQGCDLRIATEQTKKETAIFEPKLSASFNYKDSTTPNTAEEYYESQSMETYEERLRQYRMGFSGLLPVGMIYSFDYTIDEISNDFVDNRYNNEANKETSTYLGIQLTQPLLKNRGAKNIMAKIRIAKTSQDISYQEYRNKVMDVVFASLNAYWELYYTTKQHEFYTNSVQIALDLLQTYTLMVEAGKIAESELFEIKSGLSLRQSLLSAASQKKIEAQNRIFQLMGKPKKGIIMKHFILLDTPTSYKNYKDISYEKVLEQALLNNPRYLSSLKNLNKQKIHTEYTKNQNLPELNLKASFGINSLEHCEEQFLENLWNDNEETWSVGFEFMLPLNGRIDTKSAHRMARIRKKQAQIGIQLIKRDLENQIDSRIQQVRNSVDQLKRHNDNVRIKQKIMDLEMSRLDGGKSNIIVVLEKEKQLNQAKNGHLRATVNFEISKVALKRVDGTLLKSYGLDIEKNLR
jgi:outer membrane protein TolC